MRRAQNDVLAAVGVCERKLSSDSSYSGDNFLRAFGIQTFSEDVCGVVLYGASAVTITALTGWIRAVGDRLLVGDVSVSKPNADHVEMYEAPDLPLWTIMQLQRRRLGAYDFFVAGVPLDILRDVVFYLNLGDGIIFGINRLMLAYSSSRRSRQRWAAMRPYVSRVSVSFPFPSTAW